MHMFSWFLCPSLNSGELIKDGYTICEQESKKRRPHMLPCFLCVISLQKNVQCGFLFFLYSNLTIGDYPHFLPNFVPRISLLVFLH
jgi:hypothetical protein